MRVAPTIAPVSSEKVTSTALAQERVVGRQDGRLADRLAQTWDTCVNGVKLGFRLRARVGDTI